VVENFLAGEMSNQKIHLYDSMVGREERRENCTRFWWESLKERDHSEDQGIGGRMGSEWILGRMAWWVWIGYEWHRIGTGGVLL
jgi:hypothetical protein